ncbi:TPA: hypothetical protein HA225_00155 [Candidatus Micrarchaeota archaeon]|nr:hypothetical protein [Candidatus Micrarchaeota archaeon]
MQKMSFLELEAAVAELAHLEGKRIAKIRRTDGGIFLFKIGSEEVLFEPGVRLHLTRQALHACERPDGFASYLRKNFEGKTAAKISQVPRERIVEIVAKSKERLIFELFRKGNLIACGEDGIIVSCLEMDTAGGRRIARGEAYQCPKSTPFEPSKPEKPGFFVQLDKNGTPVSYSLDASKGGREFVSFSEAADFYYSNQSEESKAESDAKERVKKLQERLSSQEKILSELAEKRKSAASAGDAIYENFQGVEELLQLVRQLKKSGKTEEQINRELAGHKAKISGISLELQL